MAWRPNGDGYERDYPPPYEPEYRESDARYTRDYGPVPSGRRRPSTSAARAPREVLSPQVLVASRLASRPALQFTPGGNWGAPVRPLGGSGFGSAILRTYDSVRAAKRRRDGRVAVLRITKAARHAREVLAGMEAMPEGMPPVREYLEDAEDELARLRALIEEAEEGTR